MDEEKKRQTSIDEALNFIREIHEEIQTVDKLSEDHRNLETFLKETIQPKMQFLLSRHQEADQIATAARKGHVRTPRYNPLEAEIGYFNAIRVLVVQAVYSIWDAEGRPTRDRREVIPVVQDRVRELKKLRKWPPKWGHPGRDTIIRRLNESADVRHYPDDPCTPTIAVKPGQYMPNPQRFEEPIRSQLTMLSAGWMRKRK